MQTASPERRKTPRRKSFLHQEAVSVQAQGTESRPIMVKVKDVSEFGLGVESATPLQRGCIVLITGTISKGISHKKLARAPAKITHCEQSNPGCYVIGLEFTPEGDQAPNAQSLPDSTPDYYDILQLSPKADPDTIHRVYRLLAQRYHPDNRETGDQDLFKQVLDAYRVLSDPQKRAAYDAAFMSTRQLRWKIFDQANATQGREGEKRKRAGILSVLYAQRLNEPLQGGVTIHELEDLLGCPREHLEFSLWYLRETGCVLRTDNGRYSITAKGVETSEALEMVPSTASDRMLPAAQFR